MLMDADAAQLEWRVAAELSQDPIMMLEIINGIDIHSDNAKNFFGDLRFRQDAKIFSFRLLYGGTAYAFFMDPKMPAFSQKRWNEIVEAFYTKYSGLKKWQDDNFKLVTQTGKLQTFTGRIYSFEMKKQNDGSWCYERPSVCNYPVQGTATGDIIPLVMCQVQRLIRNAGLSNEVLIVNQVHDSIVLDLDRKHIDQVAQICYKCFRSIPSTIKAYWNYDWTTPMDGDIKIGENWSEMIKYKAPTL